MARYMFHAVSTETPPARLPAANISVVGFSGTFWPSRRTIGSIAPTLPLNSAEVAMSGLRMLMLGLRTKLESSAMCCAKHVPNRTNCRFSALPGGAGIVARCAGHARVQRPRGILSKVNACLCGAWPSASFPAR